MQKSKERNESIMEATLMNLVGFISTAVLSLTLVAAAPMYAQEQHGQDEQKAKPEEKRAQPEKSARQEQKPAAQQEKNNRQEGKNAQQQDKNTRQEEKSAQQQQRMPQAKSEQQAHRAGGNGGGRIPDDRFKANFGEQHRFRVSHADYDNRRFQYGGYWFAFSDPWPSNWLYTQDVYVIEIDGVYYLCNAMYPGINIAISFTP